MQQKVTAKNASILKIDKLTFFVEDGRLTINIPEARFPHVFSACETLAVLNLLSDFKLDIILVAREEQRERDRKNKERQGHKKPQMIQVDGRWVEGVELSELEQEQND